ncbi:hypothetical protein SELMODRAFT_441538 [Selaginella moellendorffii]|uniref:Sec16 Sec23-binding domain-containing protein n=2 Tax=Selaginella moellendorffii TaxID=88036 RepID=D8RKH3_SELML|nr:hypothetical protein SELMODRAFT_441538 [Selaginella moellendorffii]
MEGDSWPDPRSESVNVLTPKWKNIERRREWNWSWRHEGIGRRGSGGGEFRATALKNTSISRSKKERWKFIAIENGGESQSYKPSGVEELSPERFSDSRKEYLANRECATAFEVKRLLIAGKQKEALRAAQGGQLWGCALLMARQLGEKFYTDTIAEMAQRQFQPGSSTSTGSSVSGDIEMRLCLIGADDCKYPRTYASPEAIQRMEVYEFARVTGNSQFILPPFQPYKLIYASMLAEAGKINEALRYWKTLKTAGHAADMCKEAAVALEKRLRIHSQQKQCILASSASMEPISDNTKRSNMPARSISEPDFRPAQIVSPAKGTPNRGVFTSFVQRAMGFIKTPSKEAKLGDSNKFRYDETLKRWVEEGAEAQAPDLPLAPPPTANKLVSRVEENGAPISMSPERPQPTPERAQPVVSGIPPMPPSSNQYAARARQNVRSRYVDTFNKGSVTPSKTSSDSPPLFGVVPKASAKPLAPARFFVPAAAAAAAPDINSNHSVDPSSAPAFVSDTAFSNGNGAFAQPVVQDMRNDPGPTPDHLSSSSSPAMFYSNHYPAAPSTVSLPPPPALEVTPQ